MTGHAHVLRVGIAGPVSLDLLHFPLGLPDRLPPGYPAPIVAHFANALVRRGHEVVLYTTSGDISEPVILDQGELIVCIAPRYRPRSALTFFSQERRHLNALMARYPVDLIHAMWSYEFALAALDSGRPVTVHYRDHAWTILKHSRDAYRLIRWLLSEYVTLRARCKITNSEYLKTAFGRRGRNMEVIPNFLPSADSKPAGHSASAGGYVVTVSNGFGGWKNVRAGLEAFGVLRRQDPGIEYHLIGADLGVGEAAEVFARRHALAQGVRFLGRLPYSATLAEIAGASVLLHPSLEESFGMTLLEAMAAGVVVVAGRRSGNVPELLDGGDCGFLCDVRDHEDVARCLAQALANTGTTAGMTARARQRCLDVYSETVVIDTLESYYATILAGQAAGGKTP